VTDTWHPDGIGNERRDAVAHGERCVKACSFKFDGDVAMGEAEATLLLSAFAAEGIHGCARVQLEFSYELDEAHRAVVVRTDTEVGETISRIFAGLLLREFGEEVVELRPVEELSRTVPSGKAA
jgi:hypothetical protein